MSEIEYPNRATRRRHQIWLAAKSIDEVAAKLKISRPHAERVGTRLRQGGYYAPAFPPGKMNYRSVSSSEIYEPDLKTIWETADKLRRSRPMTAAMPPQILNKDYFEDD